MIPVLPKINPFKDLEEYIHANNHESAINELFLLIKNIDHNSPISEIYRYLFQLLPSITDQFGTLMQHLPRLFSASSHLYEEQRTLAFRLGQRSLESAKQSPSFQSFHEAMDYFAKALRIEETIKTPFSENIHRLASLLILQFYLLTGTFKDRLERAIRQSRVEEFGAVLYQIEQCGHFCCEPQDGAIIREFYNIARDVWVAIKSNQEHLYSDYGKIITEKRSALFPLSKEYPTKNYHQLLSDIRNEFKNRTYCNNTPKEVRAFQRHIFHKFQILIQVLLSDAFILLGPPPCHYELTAMGSMGREEPCPFSDLEFFILIDGEEYRPYFLTLLQIFELQILSLGETANAHLVFTCLHHKNRSGFHIDTGGNPSKDLILLSLPEALASLQNSNQAVHPSSPAHTTLKCKSLCRNTSSPLLFERFQKGLQLYLDSRKERAHQYCLVRLKSYQETWQQSFLPPKLDLKTHFVELLNHLFADLSLYFVIEATNTLDIIDALVDKTIFSKRSGDLIKEVVSWIYDFRLRIHEIYKEQREEVFLEGLEGYVLTSKEKFQLEKAYWLIIRPLYTALSKGKNFEEIFVNVDLIQVSFEEILQSKDPNSLKPWMFHLVKHLIEIKTPYADHRLIFSRLSQESKTDLLRQLYLDLPESQFSKEEMNEIAFIPNKSGSRLLFLRNAHTLRTKLEQMTSSSPIDTGNFPVKEVKIIGYLEGGYLKPEFIKQLLDEKGDIRRSYQDSMHLVSSAAGLHFKQKPTHPLMEYAIHNLFFRIAGPLTPSTQLVRFEVTVGKEKRIYPVLVSETLPGMTLKEALKKKFELSATAWARWTWMLLASILTRPGDGLSSNYLIDQDQNISCIDNDISFVEPVVKDGFFSKKVNFCSALFCIFPHKSLDPEVLKEFCSINLDEILNGWIEDVIEKEKEYLSLFSEKERDELYNKDEKNRFKATILFREGTLATLNLQFFHMQKHFIAVLQQNKTITPIGLLKHLIGLKDHSIVENPIGNHVSQAYEKSLSLSSVGERLKQITARKDEKSMTSLQSDMACLGKVPTLEEIEKKELFTPSKAREELFVTLLKRSSDYISSGIVQGKRVFQISFKQMSQNKVPDLDRQRLVLKAVTHLLHLEPEKPASIALQHCAVLDSETLLPFLHEDLECLDLSFCAQIKDRDIETIQQKCPFLHTLHLSGCAQLRNIGRAGLFSVDPLDFSREELMKLTESTDLGVGALISVEEGKKITSVRGDETTWISLEAGKKFKMLRTEGDEVVVDILIYLEGDKKIASVSDEIIQIWDVKTGKELKRLTGHNGKITTLISLAGGKKIATGSHDGSIRIWDVKTGKELKKMAGYKDIRTLISLEGDKKIASVSYNKIIRIWNLTPGLEHLYIDHCENLQSINIRASSLKTLLAAKNPQLSSVDLGLETICFPQFDLENCDKLDVKKILKPIWDRVLKSEEKNILPRILSPSTMIALAEIVEEDPTCHEKLFSLIEESKKDPMMATTAANAITLLNFAHVSFVGKDFRGIRIPGANLRRAILLHTDLRGADLTGVDLSEALLNYARLDQAKMENVKLGFSIHSDSTIKEMIVLTEKKQIIGGCEDGDIRIWDLETGLELKKLKGQGCVNAMILLQGGKLLASATNFYGSDSDHIEIWNLECDVQSLETPFDLRGGDKWPASVRETMVRIGYFFERIEHGIRHYRWAHSSVVELNEKFASSEYDHSICIWDPRSGIEHKKLIGHTDLITTLIPMEEGKKLVSASKDKTIRIWNPETGEELKKLIGHTDSVTTIVPFEKGKKLISASEDKTIRIWNSETGEELKKLIGHTDSVNTLLLSEGGDKLISGSQDKTIRSWDIETGKELKKITGHKDGVQTIISLEGDKKFVSRDSNTIRIWNPETEIELKSFNKSYLPIQFILPLERIKKFASWDAYNISIWDLETGMKLKIIPREYPENSYFAFEIGKKHILVSGTHKIISFWDVEAGKEFKKFIGHTEKVNTIIELEGGIKLASGSDDKTIRIWDVETGKEHKKLIGHTESINDIIPFEGGKKLVSASKDKTIRIWDLDNGIELKKFIVNHSVRYFIPSEDVNELIYHSNELTTLYIEAKREFRCYFSLSENPADIIIPLKGGKKLVFVSDDKTIVVMDTETRKGWKKLAQYKSLIKKIIILEDGKKLVTSGEDNTIRIWDFETEKMLFSIQCFQMICSLNFIEPNLLVAGDKYGYLWCWKLDFTQPDLAPQLLWSTYPMLDFTGVDISNVLQLSELSNRIMIAHGAKSLL